VQRRLATIAEILGPPPQDLAPPVRAAIEAIHRVHLVPMIEPRVPIVRDKLIFEGGMYRWTKATGLPLDIRLNPGNDHLDLTVVLEIGHFLDHQAVGTPGEFASIAHAHLADWRRAVDSSRSIEKLEDFQAAGTIPYRFTDGNIRHVDVSRIAGSLLQPPELFSRSYAQFIVQQSENDAMIAQLHGFTRDENPSSVVPYYWPDDDFDPIAAALRRLIINLGWSK
jgi:hypothetical protein